MKDVLENKIILCVVMAVLDFTLETLSQMSLLIQSTRHMLMSECDTFCNVYIVCDLIIMLLSSEIPPAERITSATQANNANKEPHTTTEQIEISEYRVQTLRPGSTS